MIYPSYSSFDIYIEFKWNLQLERDYDLKLDAASNTLY